MNDERALDEIEKMMNRLPTNKFCPIYLKLFVVSLRNSEDKNRRALLLHVPQCSHPLCRLIQTIFKDVTDSDSFKKIIEMNIESDEERLQKEMK